MKKKTVSRKGVKSTEKRRSYKHDARNKIKRLKIDTDWHEEKKKRHC
jgi:hypothetical protein